MTILILGVFIINMDWGLKIFGKLWENLFFRSMTIVLFFCTIFNALLISSNYLFSFMLHGNFMIIGIINVFLSLLQYPIITGATANITAELITFLLISIVLFFQINFQASEIGNRKYILLPDGIKNNKKIELSDFNTIVSFGLLFYSTCNLGVFIFVIYLDIISKIFHVIFIIKILLLICSFILMYLTIKEYSQNIVLKSMVKKTDYLKVKQIVDNYIEKNKPVLISGDEIIQEHIFALDIGIIDSINRKKIKNLEVNQKIAISVPTDIINRYLEFEILENTNNIENNS
jgi:hypothetical protein